MLSGVGLPSSFRIFTTGCRRSHGLSHTIRAGRKACGTLPQMKAGYIDYLQPDPAQPCRMNYSDWVGDDRQGMEDVDRSPRAGSTLAARKGSRKSSPDTWTQLPTKFWLLQYIRENERSRTSEGAPVVLSRVSLLVLRPIREHKSKSRPNQAFFRELASKVCEWNLGAV